MSYIYLGMHHHIAGIKGSQITAKRRGVTVTRNSSHFKRVIPYLHEVDDPYSSSSEDEDGRNGSPATTGRSEDLENDIATRK